MRQLGISLKTRLSLVAALITCAVVVLAAPPAQADTITTVAGGGSTLGDGGPATSARLDGPTAVVMTSDGGYLIADSWNSRVRKVSAGGTITTVAGGGSLGVAAAEGQPATSATLSGVWGLDVLPGGGFVVVESHRVRKVDSAGIIRTVAGTGVHGYNGDGIPATSAQLWSPTAISALPDGGFLIADNDSNRIRKVDAAGYISTVAGNGVAGSGGDGNLATSAQINSPRGVEATADGGFLITGEDGRVRKVDAFGIISTVAGGGTDTTPDGGPATSAALNVPGGIEEEAGGAFVFAEQFGKRVHRVTAGGVLRTVAGTGGAGFSGDGGEATSATLHPMDVATVADGYLIADLNNGRIRKVTLTDADNDGVYDRDDNCAADSNADQADQDGDGQGDACDSDRDGDGVGNGDDNCPADPNSDQSNIDGDADGDACDSDIDGDGAANGDDAFPRDASETADTDSDGVGDNGDAFPSDPSESKDSDGDGLGDNGDNCPADANAGQEDLDGDGQGDACDSDIDGDGAANGDDAFPRDASETTDTDADGVGDNGDNCPTDANADQANLDSVSGDTEGDACDSDIDGDGAANGDDAFPRDATETADSDGDGVGDNADAFDNDPTETTDTDLDGVGDNGDNCRVDANEDQADIDGDGHGDACDGDIDGDGVANGDDVFPFDPAESSDRDGDGIGDNGDRFPDDPNESADTDDDTVGDGADNCREQSNTDQADQDGDGTGDVCDGDVDGDSVANGADNCRTTANEDQADRDEDGTGDACDDTPRPTPASICALLTEYVAGSEKYAAQSSTKQAAVDESLGNICDSIATITAKLSPQHKAVLVRLRRLSVKAFAQDWLTSEQAAKLDRLIGNM